MPSSAGLISAHFRPFTGPDRWRPGMKFLRYAAGLVVSSFGLALALLVSSPFALPSDSSIRKTN